MPALAAPPPIRTSAATPPPTPPRTPPRHHPPSDQVVRDAIADISHIATLPEVTMRIIELVEDPNATAEDLNKVISHDPALGARILKVVNSAFYGLPGQIGSLNRAIVLLGLNAVKNIAIAASLAKLFKGGQVCNGFDARDLWTHCVATATASRMLVQRLKLPLRDEAFLAGLIHDIGIMVEVQAVREGFVEAIEAMRADPSLSLREAEAAWLGADHEQFGMGVCRLWKFPTAFVNVTGQHHHPWNLPSESRQLASIVYVAQCLSSRCGHSITMGTEPMQPRVDVLDELGLTEADLDELATSLPAAVEEAEAVMSMGGG